MSTESPPSPEPRQDEPAPGPPDVGGDPACWLNQVCDECGRMIEDPLADVCSNCGTPRASR